MARALRLIFLGLVTVGALAAVFGVIVAVGVARLAHTAPTALVTETANTASVSRAAVVASTNPATGPSHTNIAGPLPGSNVIAAGSAHLPGAEPAAILLNAADARLHGSIIRRDADTHDVIGWSHTDDWLEWRVEAPASRIGTYYVEITYSCAPGMGGDFAVKADDQSFASHGGSTGSWTEFKTTRVGTVRVPGGKSRLSLTPAPGLQHELMRLRRVELVPAAAGESITALSAPAPSHAAPAPAAQVPAASPTPPGPPRVADGSLAVIGFTLIDTVPNAPIGQLTDGATLDLGVLPARHMSIRADVAGTPGSVMFALDQNPRLHLEHDAPYAINSDHSGRFIPWDPPLGRHTLTVTPYVGHDGNGTAGKAATVHFTVSAPGRERTSIVCKAQDARLHGAGIVVEQVDGGQDIGFWDKTDQSAEWPVEGRGKFNVLLTYAADDVRGGGDFQVKVGDQTLNGHADPTGGWQKYRVLTLGAITVGGDRTAVIVKPTRLDGGKSLMNLRRVELVPVE